MFKSDLAALKLRNARQTHYQKHRRRIEELECGLAGLSASDLNRFTPKEPVQKLKAEPTILILRTHGTNCDTCPTGFCGCNPGSTFFVLPE